VSAKYGKIIPAPDAPNAARKLPDVLIGMARLKVNVRDV
jgi:hypothetical protein